MIIHTYDYAPVPEQSVGTRKQRSWTTQQMATLRAEYGLTPHEELAAHLGRTVRAMQKMAADNGISAWHNRHARDAAMPRRGWYRRSEAAA